jgi:hypothetical protein
MAKAMTEHFHDLPNYFSTGSDDEKAAAHRILRASSPAGITDRRNGPDDHIHIKAPLIWQEPRPIPDGLLPVKVFALDYLPENIAPWVGDISERMQCPPDFVGITAMVALGSVLGRKIAIRPQRETDWEEVPNLWGCVVGLKSGARDRHASLGRHGAC